MFCPKCRAEYQEGYQVCQDCKVDLVAGRPPEIRQEVDFIEYELIGAIHNPADIPLFKSILTEENIAHFFQGEEFSFLYPGVAVNLMVRKDQAETARELLQEISNSGQSPEIEDPSGDA